MSSFFREGAPAEALQVQTIPNTMQISELQYLSVCWSIRGATSGVLTGQVSCLLRSKENDTPLDPSQTREAALGGIVFIVSRKHRGRACGRLD